MADSGLAPMEWMRAQAAMELMEVNRLTERFGLALNRGQIARIVERRAQALKDAGRVEFGPGILKQLAEAFCDSPYVNQRDYEEILSGLIDSFYYFKGAVEGLLSDGDLIDCMRRYFDGVCHGSLEALNDASISELTGPVRGDLWSGN